MGWQSYKAGGGGGVELCLSILSSLGLLPGEAAPRHLCHFQQEWVSRRDRVCVEG